MSFLRTLAAPPTPNNVRGSSSWGGSVIRGDEDLLDAIPYTAIQPIPPIVKAIWALGVGDYANDASPDTFRLADSPGQGKFHQECKWPPEVLEAIAQTAGGSVIHDHL